MPREGQRSKNGERGEHARAIFLPAVLIFGLCTRTECALALILSSTCDNVWAISTAVLSFNQMPQFCYFLQLAQLCFIQIVQLC